MAVTVEGLDKLLKKLGKMGPDVYKPAVAEAATHVKDVIARYPPRRYGPQPFKTARQRAYVLWALKNGIIEIPYRRGMSPGSQAVGRRWTVEFRDGGLTAAVGNNASYVRYLHDAEQQSAYHQTTGWKTDKQIAIEEAEPVKEILARHVREALKRG